MENLYDVIVLGGGPAGLTAGIYLSRSKMKTLIVDTGSTGGQMNLTDKVVNYPGVLEGSGAEIAFTMRRQAQNFGCRIIVQAEISELDIGGKIKKIKIEDEGEFSARAVIIATGGIPRTLGLPSESKFKGKGISFCATCDGDFFTGKNIAVIGGGNSAIEEAVSLTKYAKQVTVIHEFDHFQAHAWAVSEAEKNPKINFLMEQTVTEFLGEDNLEAVVSVHKKTGKETRTEVSGVFLFIGYVPNTSMFKNIVKMNEREEIITDHSHPID
ncbi:MAG TPA: FAD-dependent oxidoreductase [bacterium]|nr:FAD-dependent oxidoreductase [bacterium]